MEGDFQERVVGLLVDSTSGKKMHIPDERGETTLCGYLSAWGTPINDYSNPDVDTFRLDEADHIPHDFCSRCEKSIKNSGKWEPKRTFVGSATVNDI